MMDQTIDTVEYTHQDGTQDVAENFFDAEFVSQDIKSFQLETLFQEVEQIAQTYTPSQLDEALLPA